MFWPATALPFQCAAPITSCRASRRIMIGPTYGISSLAMMHFQSVYINYFERPNLHTIANWSGKLWSPLVALAAFFEDRDGLTGLLDIISQAAQWDEQVSDGKSLSKREEAVLQSLELMSRDDEETFWVKGAELREKIRTLLGHSPEEMGNAQWIGHLL